MEISRCRVALVLALGSVMALSLSTATASDRKEFKYKVGPGAGIDIVNEFGPVNITVSSGNQVAIAATPHSSKVEVDSSQSGNRVEVRTHFLQSANQNEGQVDYDISVPADANVTVNAGTGAVHIDKLAGDVSVQGETGAVDAQNLNGAYLHIRTVNGPITLTNVSNGHVEATSVGGNVTLTNVSGPKVYVTSTKGSIRYDGDPAGGGEYQLINYTGDIDVALPASASVDVTARTISGSVQNDFPLQTKAHTSFVPDAHSFAGTSASGASMLRLSSFSGKIRVRKK
jgi:DUF4097 and DUF4098 domain-containing protein YvlB